MAPETGKNGTTTSQASNGAKQKIWKNTVINMDKEREKVILVILKGVYENDYYPTELPNLARMIVHDKTEDLIKYVKEN